MRLPHQLPQRIILWVETSPQAILIGLVIVIMIFGTALCFVVDRTLSFAVMSMAGAL